MTTDRYDIIYQRYACKTPLFSLRSRFYPASFVPPRADIAPIYARYCDAKVTGGGEGAESSCKFRTVNIPQPRPLCGHQQCGDIRIALSFSFSSPSPAESNSGSGGSVRVKRKEGGLRGTNKAGSYDTVGSERASVRRALSRNSELGFSPRRRRRCGDKSPPRCFRVSFSPSRSFGDRGGTFCDSKGRSIRATLDDIVD